MLITLNHIKIDQFRARMNQDVVLAKGKIVNARQQMTLAAESSEFAKKALEQSIGRQEAGIVRPYEILQVQEIYVHSRFDYIKAVAAHNKAQYRLFVALGNDL